MTEGQKKLAIVGVIVLAIVLLFWPKRAGGQVIEKGGSTINVDIPSLSLPPRTGMVINIPGLPSFSPYSFSPISPCMCNAAGGTSPLQMPAGVQITNITNMGNSGPNVYNYTAPKSSTGGLTGIYFASAG